ncbi:hypothetical protein PCANC_03890 [Puccinia coronata f. sp. avenae]|uniref:Uncharacterized protein n=1 Tax=Puccinia coronata f. sp. avenae TaxID=200324 RepID=A0A2N5W194_9BASI|nr:hypothetical protein PCANC_08654 [Puccinia coronata f. sp. avenae]PLW56024.1 hypothetical protein PCANC_03890 [Puccinia coronata f. sp. avenae]
MRLSRRAGTAPARQESSRRAGTALAFQESSRRAGTATARQESSRRVDTASAPQESSRRAGTVPALRLLASWYIFAGLPGGYLGELVWYVPACQKALPASWYITSSPGGSPGKLVGSLNELVLISAHQESPEYSAPARWGSAGERFCRVGIWRVPAAGTRLFFHPKSRHLHPYPAPVGRYLLKAKRYPQKGAGYPQTGT